jgi:tetratricopeptide (TPR) repeat protein
LMTPLARAPGAVAALTLSWLAMLARPAAAQTADSDVPAAAPVELETSEPAGDPGSGSAPTDGAGQAARDEAARRFEAARSLYAQGDVELAAIELERAYELVPDQSVLYNLGQLRLKLRHYARARRALERYLEQAGADLPAERRESVGADLEVLRSRTATLHVTANVEGAEVVVDDTVVGHTPLSAAVLLDAGEHRIAVRKPGYATRRARVLLGGAESKALEVSLELVSEQSGSPALSRSNAQPPVRLGDAAPARNDAWTWIAWSAAGTLAASAAVTGILGIVASNDLDRLKDNPDVTRGELESTGRRAQGLLLASDILAGASLVAAGTALYLTFSGGARSKQPPPSKTGLGVGVSFTHVGVIAAF